MTDISIDSITRSIEVILEDGDLDHLSAKKIRRMLEAEYKTDLTVRKEEIDKLVMRLLTELKKDDETEQTQKDSKGTNIKQKPENGSSKPVETCGPVKQESAKDNPSGESKMSKSGDASDDDDGGGDHSELSDLEEEVPRKKAKTQPSSKSNKKITKKVKEENQDEELKEEGCLRPSRRCKAQPTVRKQKKPRKEGTKGTSIYSRPCVLLPPLTGVLDTDRMPRPMIVKRLWEIVKERNLLDPKNKQFMLCDEQMKELFGRARVRMFGVMKLLKPYIKDLPKD